MHCPLWLLWWVCLFVMLGAPLCAAETGAAESASPVLTLYRALRKNAVDPKQVYHVREAVLDRDDLHIYLTYGTIIFTQAIDGHVTGAFFDGEGEILLRPPDQVERASLGLFTGLGLLDEHFTTTYFRFNDATFEELRERLQPVPADEAAEFTSKWSRTAEALSDADSLRLLCSFTSDFGEAELHDRYLHARVTGGRMGLFDVVYDSMAEDQVSVWKVNRREDRLYLDNWMAFPTRRARAMKSGARVIDPWKSFTSVNISDFKINAELLPPEEIDAQALLNMHVTHGGQRLLYLELSRYLQVKEVKADGAPIEFLQNESIEGSELARQGNDYVILILPKPLRDGQTLSVEVKYRGNVMAQAGVGLLYVGARGTWYPNRGMVMANFDLQFRWPEAWTLVATGRRVSSENVDQHVVGRWISDGPMPLAGFNLGQYNRKSARAGDTAIEAYATAGMEFAFQSPPQRSKPMPGSDRGELETAVVIPSLDEPVLAGQTVADRSARAVEQFSQWFGPYPYSSLSLTQFPGPNSQGWPSLIFLSGMVFLTQQERERLSLSPFAMMLYDDLMQIHETAHQWWGGAVSWNGYRDQWLLEALANYSALMMIERTNPAEAQKALEFYREQLLEKSPNGKQYLEAGPVTLGLRLYSSEFPSGYTIISYGRGTWLLHMMRHMFRDTAPATAGKSRAAAGDELFLHALKTLRERYSHRQITTRDLISVFEEHLPEPLRYNGSKSLDWFTEGWVNGTAIPKLSLSDVKISATSASFTLKQEDAPEELVTSVPVYAVVGERQVLAGRVFADGSHTRARLTVPAGTRRLILDPNQTVLSRK